MADTGIAATPRIAPATPGVAPTTATVAPQPLPRRLILRQPPPQAAPPAKCACAADFGFTASCGFPCRNNLLKVGPHSFIAEIMLCIAQPIGTEHPDYLKVDLVFGLNKTKSQQSIKNFVYSAQTAAWGPHLFTYVLNQNPFCSTLIWAVPIRERSQSIKTFHPRLSGGLMKLSNAQRSC